VRWVTFDCYGTLIDWERGITDALLPLLPPGVDRVALARRYIEIEAGIEGGEYSPYREVLDRAGQRLAAEHGRALPDGVLPLSLRYWQPYPEVPASLLALRERGYRIAILSNVDRDLLDASIRQLGIAPDLAVTAQDCGSYKPAPGHWLRFQQASGASVVQTVHVGASQYHDMRPAASLGYRTVFVDRHGEPLTSTPTRVLPDLSMLPAAIGELDSGDRAPGP